MVIHRETTGFGIEKAIGEQEVADFFGIWLKVLAVSNLFLEVHFMPIFCSELVFILYPSLIHFWSQNFSQLNLAALIGKFST